MTKVKHFRLFLALFLLLPMLSGVVFANGPKARAADTSSGLSVTPRKQMVLKPGGSVSDTLIVNNLSQVSALQVSLRVVDFTFYNQTGTPKFFIASNAPMTPWSLRPYVTVPQTVTVMPGQSQTIKYSVKIPKNLGGGSYYSAIFYSTGAPSAGNVNLSATGVTLMFVTVPGNVNESLTLDKFGTYSSNAAQTQGEFTYFNLNEPRQIAYIVKNNGNVAEAPAGSVSIRNLWGSSEVTTDDANPNQALALIGQTRLVQTCIKDKPKGVDTSKEDPKNDSDCASPELSPGRYTATINLLYGQNGNETHSLQQTVIFWYIPIWLLILIFIVLLILAYIVWRIVRRIKQPARRKKKIANKRR